MPWWLFGAGLLLTYLLQTAVLGVLGVGVVDLFLTLALLLALVAPVHDARNAACLVGFSQDLGSGLHDAPLGLFAFCLGLAALIATTLRDWVNIRLWWARGLTALAAALPAQLLAMTYLRLCGVASGGWWADFGSAWATAACAAALATLLLEAPAWVRRRPARVTRYGGRRR